ncbi:MAG: glycosyltransferase [Candidatus Andersenbacteria bacterium]
MRVCIVHDYLTHVGGGEKVLEALAEAFPDAPIFTLVHDTSAVSLAINPRRIRTSFLQKFPGARRSHRYIPLALMPFAIEQFDFSNFDIVISNTHGFAKGIVTSPRTMHISYCLTPIRYAWDGSHRYVREFSSGTLFQKFAPLAISYIRTWDYMASHRIHAYITLSHYVQKRIKKYYNADSQVIYPPVDTQRFSCGAHEGEYYVVVSRLVPYKRVDLAIRAANKLGIHLKIAGVGPEMEYLQEIAGENIEFLGFVPDADLPELYRNARALLFPQEEDFGITPVEAAASGIPTIAYGAGGALETVIQDVTGAFFSEQTPESLSDAIVVSQGIVWNKAHIKQHAEQFSKKRFIAEIQDVILEKWNQFCKQKQYTA